MDDQSDDSVKFPSPHKQHRSLEVNLSVAICYDFDHYDHDKEMHK